MDSYPCEPAFITLDIDDTCDVVHGHQQLSLFNAHYDERCFLPIHVYDTEKSRTRRAIENLAVLRGYTETRHKAKSWDRERRTVTRIEATMLGLDIRFVVPSLDVGSAEWIYDSLYCARGQAENLIKLLKTQLA